MAEVSPTAAEAFIRLGARVCLLLTNEETEQWVQGGAGQLPVRRGTDQLFRWDFLKSLGKTGRDRFRRGPERPQQYPVPYL